MISPKTHTHTSNTHIQSKTHTITRILCLWSLHVTQNGPLCIPTTILLISGSHQLPDTSIFLIQATFAHVLLQSFLWSTNVIMLVQYWQANSCFLLTLDGIKFHCPCPAEIYWWCLICHCSLICTHHQLSAFLVAHRLPSVFRTSAWTCLNSSALHMNSCK